MSVDDEHVEFDTLEELFKYVDVMSNLAECSKWTLMLSQEGKFCCFFRDKDARIRPGHIWLAYAPADNALETAKYSLRQLRERNASRMG